MINKIYVKSIHYFGDRSKIKMQRNKALCNLESANIAKKSGNIFLALILEDTTYTNH